MTANTFKERYRNYVKSFNNEKYSNETELAKHVWYLKKQLGRAFRINWLRFILRRAAFYTKTGCVLY